MNHILEQLQNHKKAFPSLEEDTIAIQSLVRGLSAKHCRFCRGYGHLANDCSSKKAIDSVSKMNYRWKMVWGTVKGEILTANVHRGMGKAMEGIEKSQRRAALITNPTDEYGEEEDEEEEEQAVRLRGEALARISTAARGAPKQQQKSGMMPGFQGALPAQPRGGNQSFSVGPGFQSQAAGSSSSVVKQFGGINIDSSVRSGPF